MDNITEEEAFRKAREALGFGQSTAGCSWRVHRLDRQAEAYYLVQLGVGESASAVAVVDAGSGQVDVSARLPNSEQHLSVDAQAAVTLAGSAASSQAELVWMPSVASRSPLYPFWRITTPEGVVKYVDQGRRVLDNLQTDQLGG